MIRRLAAFMSLMLFIAGCSAAPADAPESPELQEDLIESTYPIDYEPYTQDIDAPSLDYEPPETELMAEIEPEPEESIFPYIPETFDPERPFPILYHFDGDFDASQNNRVLFNMSFFLDEAFFVEMPTAHEHFLRFDAVPDSEIDPYIITILAEPVESLVFHAVDSEGILQEVLTLNVALSGFLSASPGEVFTYFSEYVRGRYIPAAMFVTDYAVGFIYFISDGKDVYSIQILSYDSSYAQRQNLVMADLINSIVFS